MAEIGNAGLGEIVPRFYGVVKKLKPAEGNRPAHGFIECAETQAQFGRDVFIHDKLASVLTIGAGVCFSISINQQGMPQAVEVSTEDGTGVLTDGMEHGSAAAQAGVQRAQGMAQMAAASGFPQQPQLQVAQPQWSLPNGQRLFELLVPEVLPAIQLGMGQSVAAALISAAELLGVSNDLRMQLLATVPQDKAVGLASLGAAPQLPQYQSYGNDFGKGAPTAATSGGLTGWEAWESKGGGFGKSKGAGKQNNRAAPYGGAAPTAAEAYGANDGFGGNFGLGIAELSGQPLGPKSVPQEGGPYDGVVKTISMAEPGSGKHTHGFIECEETRQIYSRDVFLHSQQAAELQIGCRVRFEVMLNQRGMPQAHNLIKFE